MVDDELTIKFRGGMADEHKLPAYAASKSLRGLSRAILIPAIYLDTGQIRHRNLENLDTELNLLAVRSGSVETVLELITHPLAMGALGALGVELVRDVAKDFIKDFIYGTIKRAIGGSTTDEIETLEASGRLSAGDMAALVDAIEPAMRDAHVTVGNGARNIVIISGGKNVITLNETTKLYLTSSEEDKDVSERDFSVASFNANTGNGRCFDYEQGRTVAFTLDDGVDAQSLQALGQSLLRYARARRLGDQQSSRVSIRYRAIRSQDGHVKKIIIYRARRES